MVQEKTKILLLGSFHLFAKDWDYSLPQYQKELQKITDSIAEFRPDAIAVEAAVHAQNSVDESYRIFKLEDLCDSEKTRNGNLGTIEMYRQTYPITYNNECIQIAYRLSKQLNIKKIYAIDDDLSFDMNILEKYPPKLLQEYYTFISESKESSILQLMKEHNSDEWSDKNHYLNYLVVNSINSSGAYEGSDYVSQWYKRNLKIFANIQNLCRSYTKVFILYGSGHLKILNDFITSCPDLLLVNTNAYLQKIDS